MARSKNYAGLSLFILKIIALLSMLASHVIIVFNSSFPKETLTWLYYFGRLAFPIFAFTIANGWKKTRNKLLYIIRILIMALVSQIPYAMALKGFSHTDFQGALFSTNLNIGFSFLLAAACLLIYDLLRKSDFPKLIALICAILPALALEFLTPFHVDYGYRGIALILTMYAFQDDRPMLFLSSSTVLAWLSSSINQFTITIRGDLFLAYFAALLLLMLYNDRQGARAKYLFYVFYPLHLIILLLLKLYVF